MSDWQLFFGISMWTVFLAHAFGPVIARALGEGNIFERIFLWLQRGLESVGHWIVCKVRRSV